MHTASNSLDAIAQFLPSGLPLVPFAQNSCKGARPGNQPRPRAVGPCHAGSGCAARIHCIHMLDFLPAHGTPASSGC